MNKLLLIDGHSILSRAFYGVPLLTASTGIHTNAVYGFLNIMFKCIDDEKADYIAVAFDLERSKLKRTQMYPEYKGTRKPMPAELHEQVPLVQEIVKAMNIPILTMEGYEADDLLGTVAKKAQEAGFDVTIVSGDRDLLQLCDEHIKIALPKTSKGRTEVFSYYPEDVQNEYQVTPSEFIDLKALQGDSSDNIPGLPGVGPKTATDIITKYKSIENAYAHVDEIKPPRAQKAMKEHYDLAELSKVLATIDIHSPIEFDPEHVFEGAGDVKAVYTQAALAKIRELELKTLITKFAKKVEAYASGVAGSSDAKNPKTNAEVSGEAGVDAQTSGESGESSTGEQIDLSSVKVVRDPFMAQVIFKDAVLEKLVGLAAFSDEFMGMKRVIASVTLEKDRIYVLVSGEEYSGEAMLEDLRSMVQKRIEAGQRIVTLDWKRALKDLNIRRNDCVYDFEIAQYVLDPGRSSYDYDDLAKSILGVTLEGRQELLGKKSAYENAMDGETRDNAIKFAAYNSLIPYLADRKILSKLKSEGALDLFLNIEMPLVYALNDMENVGIEVDRRSLADYAEQLKAQIDVLTAEIYDLAGEPFNINSPKQLGVILFEKLGITGGKKTKTGYSTAADILEKIAGEHEIVPKILRYRTLTKLYSTYAAGLADYISADDRIHGTFNQTITATGRISSTDPNLQNIPIRTEEGKEIRRVFVPQKGYTFVDADYSQVELRILAALSGDEMLINAYKNAVDVHSLTASQVFHTPLDEVTPEQRRNAKAVNFGIVYGISAFGLGEDLSISRKEANEYIEQYFQSYPKVKEYLDHCVQEAKEKGSVKTYFGRIRPIPELKSSNFMQRSFGERIAMNSPIQGTAADIMKIAMNNTAAALENMKSRIVLQVHDELLIETAPDELEEVSAIVKKCMEEAADLPVKLSVEIKNGDTWYDCH